MDLRTTMCICLWIQYLLVAVRRAGPDGSYYFPGARAPSTFGAPYPVSKFILGLEVAQSLCPGAEEQRSSVLSKDGAAQTQTAKCLVAKQEVELEFYGASFDDEERGTFRLEVFQVQEAWVGAIGRWHPDTVMVGKKGQQRHAAGNGCCGWRSKMVTCV